MNDPDIELTHCSECGRKLRVSQATYAWSGQFIGHKPGCMQTGHKPDAPAPRRQTRKKVGAGRGTADG